MFISSCFASVFFHSFARKLDVALLIGSRVYMDANCIIWFKEPQKESDVMSHILEIIHSWEKNKLPNSADLI
jgi:hypothetical protein